MTTFSHIGTPTPLLDGRERVTGAIRYTGDLSVLGMLHARLVTSTYAHANIEQIEVSEALAVAGVVAVFTAHDLPPIKPTSRSRLLLARERVRFVGQPVALVVAESEAAAEDGAEQVVVSYDPLPVAMTIDDAMADDAPLVWPGGAPGEADDAADHGAAVGEQRDEQDKPSNLTTRNHFTRGDIEAGFAAADIIVERTFTTPMIHQAYLEPQAVLAQPDPFGGGVTIYTSTQAPFHVQQQVAEILDLALEQVRVMPMEVGGGFGAKFVLYQPLIALVAQALKRPVRLVLTRMEEMAATNPAPEGRIRLRMGAKQDGSLTAMEADLIFDSGCYPGSPVGISCVLLGSFYQVPNIDIRGADVTTFKVSQSAYRAPGAPQACLALECVMDELAEKLGLDGFELRLKNASTPGDPMIHGQAWPSMAMRQVLEALREHPAWQEREQTRANGRGVGFAIGGWPGSTEPAAAVCKLDRDGTLKIQIGSVNLSGSNTGFALLAAEVFGVTPDKIRIINGDTLNAPHAGAAGGSKITYSVGPAIIKAAHDAREQAFAIAAQELEASPDDLEMVNGKVQVRGVPASAIDLTQIAAKSIRFGAPYPPVMGRGRHGDPRRSPSFCAQLAEVEVDRETGKIQVHRLVIVQDVGRAINPLAIGGQMMGGAMQGLGWALHEKMTYDEQGQLLTGSFMDYDLPKMQNAPSIETVILEIPSDHGPYGARCVGEPPIVATAGAIANAVADAIGTRLSDMPMTAPRVLAALGKF